MRVAGSGSMSGGRILQLLQSGYQEFLRWLSARSNSSLSSNLNFEEKFLSQQPQVPTGWPNLLCVCSVFSSVSVQLHWSQWPPNQSGAASKSSCTSKGLLGAGPSGIMAADAIVTDAGAMHVAGVPIVNPLTVVVWEVTPGTGNGFQATPKATSCPHMILMRVLQSQVGESNGGNHLLSLLSSTTYLENLLPVLVVRSPYRRFGLPQ